MKYNFLTLTALLLTVLLSKNALAEVVVIGNSDLGTLTHDTVMRIYTGRIIELDGVSVIPVNASPRSKLRNQFLAKFLKQDEDTYSAYWTVRRFIGKGTPPVELKDAEEILHFVLNKPGAIGYVDSREIKIPTNVKILSN